VKNLFLRHFPAASAVLGIAYLLLVASWVWQRGWLLGLVPGFYIGCSLICLWSVADWWHFDLKQNMQRQAWARQRSRSA